MTLAKVNDSFAREWMVPAKGEFRFEVSFEEAIALKLTQGTAEVFGAELALGKEYILSGCKLAVFSFPGAVLAVRGKCAVEYVAQDDLPVPEYIALHSRLEEDRSRGAGPRVLVLGSGRNSLATTLVNYAVRAGHQPVLCGLDVRRNQFFLPGCVSATSIDKVIEAEAGVGAYETCAPLCKFYGSMAVSDNQNLWLRLVRSLGEAVMRRLDTVQENARAGCIILAPGEQIVEEDSGVALVEAMQSFFGAEYIVVIGRDRLHSRLTKHFAKMPSIRVLKLPRSGGIVEGRGDAWERQYRQRTFTNYFYGSRQELNPFSSTWSFSNFALFRVLLGNEEIAPASALPLGATRKLDECRAVRAEPSVSLLLYSLLAIVLPAAAAGDDLKDEALSDKFIEGSIAGFLYVTEVNEERKTVTFLSPCPGDPPSKLLLVGSLKWIE